MGFEDGELGEPCETQPPRLLSPLEKDVSSGSPSEAFSHAGQGTPAGRLPTSANASTSAQSPFVVNSSPAGPVRSSATAVGSSNGSTSTSLAASATGQSLKREDS